MYGCWNLSELGRVLGAMAVPAIHCTTWCQNLLKPCEFHGILVSYDLAVRSEVVAIKGTV